MVTSKPKKMFKYFVFGVQINDEIKYVITKFGCPISIENLTGKEEK